MVLELCRGSYEQLDHWGYAPGIAQVWRADGDHHDGFKFTLEQLAAIKVLYRVLLTHSQSDQSYICQDTLFVSMSVIVGP